MADSVKSAICPGLKPPICVAVRASSCSCDSSLIWVPLNPLTWVTDSAATLVAVTFVAGLLPVIGNVISNTIIVVVSLSGNLSATIQSAELASRSITEVPIEVVDSKSATLGVGLAAIAAARLAATGADTATVAEAVRSRVERTHLFGALDKIGRAHV